jgi:uncharacterized 2Fe-2S/4Fe-4S cluster protein (DUF4445 family)
MTTIQIDFVPINRRIKTTPGRTLLFAAQKAGIGLLAVCNGRGTCTQCTIRVVNGETNSPTRIESQALSDQELDAGMRLACQVIPLSNGTIEIPPESTSTPQRLQVEGRQSTIPINPAVKILDVEVELPSQSDLRSDLTRLKDGLKKVHPDIAFPMSAMVPMSGILRRCGGRVRVVIHDNGTLAAILETGQNPYGMALDIGTTKLAAYLVDLQSGQTVAIQGAVNPQICYGEDVISRIAYANLGRSEKETLQEVLIVAINKLIEGLSKKAGIQSVQIVDMVVVGNTAMHHLFAGLPVRQLGEAPYVAAVSEPQLLPAEALGLKSSPAALIYLPPNIAGFVGADHVAADIASNILAAGDNTLLVDVGTNTEISLRTGKGLFCCSCASGPAFEGAHIEAGMHAAPGAIERVFYDNGEWFYSTIEGLPPVGICGSGILDAIAGMCQTGVINEKGGFQNGAAGVVEKGRGKSFELVPANTKKGLKSIHITRQDINEILLAKAAIRAGIEILLKHAGITPAEIQMFIVAGAFGSYLHLPSAVKIGMFPDLPIERFSQVGNAAGAGARMMLVSKDARQMAERLHNELKYIELTARKDFQEIFLAAMPLSNQLQLINP